MFFGMNAFAPFFQKNKSAFAALCRRNGTRGSVQPVRRRKAIRFQPVRRREAIRFQPVRCLRNFLRAIKESSSAEKARNSHESAR